MHTNKISKTGSETCDSVVVSASSDYGDKLGGQVDWFYLINVTTMVIVLLHAFYAITRDRASSTIYVHIYIFSSGFGAFWNPKKKKVVWAMKSRRDSTSA